MQDFAYKVRSCQKHELVVVGDFHDSTAEIENY
jgi:hypothetical protein